MAYVYSRKKNFNNINRRINHRLNHRLNRKKTKIAAPCPCAESGAGFNFNFYRMLPLEPAPMYTVKRTVSVRLLTND